MSYTDIRTVYNSSYYNISFGDGYLLGIHGIQTALYMQNYNNIAENINMNDIYYGYFDSTTEKMIKAFQTNNNLEPTGKLDELTWHGIYEGLEKNNGVILAITGTKQITIIDIDDILDGNINIKNYIVNGNQDFSMADKKNHITGTGGINFSSSGEFSTSNDSLGGKNFGDNSGGYIIGNNNNNFSMSYNDQYGKGDNGFTTDWQGNYIINGSEYNDELKYNYNTEGSKSLIPNYTINMPDTNRWNGTTIKDIDTGNYQKDYDFIYNLLANTSYNAGGYISPAKKSNSIIDSIVDYSGEYESSTNKPFFNPDNILLLRRSRFDIDLVYGAKGLKSRKIKNVIPMSVSQQVDASGEPIYDIYEFIAQDIVYSDNLDSE